MEPVIADGACVAVQPQHRYWPGDVLVFAGSDGRLVAHRLIGFWSGRYFTQADGSLAADSAVSPNAVLGRVAGPVGLAERLCALARFARLVLTRIGARLA
jgi:phage repressor protein C with HTH and peptisase S24 domain